MVHSGFVSKVKSFFKKKTTTSTPSPTGGMSTPSGPVLVTPSGEIVGSAFIGGGGSGGGGGGGTSTITPAISISIIDEPRRPGGSGIQPKIDVSRTIAQQVLSAQELKAIGLRQQLKEEATRRGKGFGRLEAERFLGGGAGVSALRKGKRKLRRIGQITGLSFTQILTGQLEPSISAVSLPPKKLEPGISEQLILDSSSSEPLIKEDVKQGGFFERIGTPKIIRQTLGVTPFEGGLREISKGTQLQSAVFLSFAGVKIPKLQQLKIPLRQAREPSFIEVQQPLIIGGKPTTISSFRITRETAPPTLVGTKAEGLLGGRIQPAKLEVTTTPLKVIDKFPTLTLTTKGGRVGKLDIITGVSKPTGVESLGQLTPRQQFLFQRFAEARVGGRPVALKNIPKVLKKDLEFDLGQLQAVKLGRVDIGKQPTGSDLLPTKQAGKRITRFETLSQFEKVGKTDQFDVFRGVTFFKDVTKPFARAK